MKDIFSERPKNGEAWDVCIIGSGPAGFSGAIYTTRGAASTLLLAGEEWGGQLMLTTTVDNFPGFPKGIEGPELMNLMRQQAERFGADIVEKKAEKLDFSKKPFEISTNDTTYLAKSVIIATGAETRWLGVSGESEFRGRGVSSCAPCDAPFFKDKKVVVIGGGDSAMEEALVLTKYATSVTIIHRRSEFRASKAMQEKVLGSKKIKVIWDSEVSEFKGKQKLEKVMIKNVGSGNLTELETDGAFVAIGHEPATKIFQNQIELDEKGFVKRFEDNEFKMKTSKEGVFVAGDVHDYHYKQAVTAAGFGTMAALEVLKYLDKDMPSW
jgi:thioredoxin reductase (NADPH)